MFPANPVHFAYTKCAKSSVQDAKFGVEYQPPDYDRCHNRHQGRQIEESAEQGNSFDIKIKQHCQTKHACCYNRNTKYYKIHRVQQTFQKDGIVHHVCKIIDPDKVKVGRSRKSGIRKGIEYRGSKRNHKKGDKSNDPRQNEEKEQQRVIFSQPVHDDTPQPEISSK
ncbi:hypothetical protein D3C74_363290 [compost metagenome]